MRKTEEIPRMRRTAYLVEKSRIQIREELISQPGDGQAAIQVHAVGVCGSDVSYYTKGATGMGEIEYPHILGHECAGEILECGRGCGDLKAGDRVAVEPGVPCGICEYCRRGLYHLCETMAFMSSAIKRPGGEGGMADRILRPAHFIYKIPDHVSYEQAALIEPISVAMHALEKSGMKPGQNVAILGCGPIAGCILLTLKACGAGAVWMTDIDGDRAAFMERIGASGAFPVKGFKEEALRCLLPEPVDIVFDTTCDETALNAGMYWLKRGGTIIQVGVPTGKKNIDLQTLFARELTLRTSFRFADTYPRAIALIAEGKLKPELLVTHRFALEQADEAMRTAADKRDRAMKVMLEW